MSEDMVEEVVTVKCDICDVEVANSEELKAHKEREHPDDDQGTVEAPQGMER